MKSNNFSNWNFNDLIKLLLLSKWFPKFMYILLPIISSLYCSKWFINISCFMLHRWMRYKWENVCWPRKWRWTGIVVTWLLRGLLTGLAWWLDLDTLQVCMMVAALSTASRFVVLSSLFRFHVLTAAKRQLLRCRNDV